jgi:hypothetical protein
MQFETRYSVTSRLQSQAVAQLFFSIYLKRKWLGFVLVWTAALLSVLAGAAIGFALTGFLAALGFVQSLIWGLSYQRLQRQGRAYAAAFNGTQLLLQLDATGLLITTPAGSQRIEWCKLSQIVHSKNFVILLLDGNPLLFIPHSALNGNVIDWLDRLELGCQ